MSILSTNKKLSYLKSQKNLEKTKDREILIQGLFWDSNDVNIEKKNPREVLNDDELSFLSDLKSSEITTESEAKQLAETHGISDDRFDELNGKYFDALSERDLSILNDMNTRELTLDEISSLELKGFMVRLKPNEIDFATSLRKQKDMTTDDTFKIGIMRTRHRIDEKVWKYLNTSRAIQILTPEEKSWLEKVEKGSSLEDLEKEKVRLGVPNTWHLKDRIIVDTDGKAAINYAPIWNGECLSISCDRAKVNWYEDVDSLDKRNLKVHKINRNDLDIVSGFSSHGFWRNVRKKALLQELDRNSEARKNLFDQLTLLEKSAILSKDTSDLTARQLDAKKRYQSLFGDEFINQEKENLISNDEYFFLSALRKSPKNMDKLSKAYGVCPENLKQKGYLDYLNDQEEEILKKYVKEEELNENENDVIRDLKKSYFITTPTSAESKFLGYLSGKDIKDKDDLIKHGEKFLIPKKQIEGLKARGFIDYLDKNELDFLQKLSEDKNQNIDELADEYDVARPSYLKDRISEDTIDTSIKVNESEKRRWNPRIQYRESRDLLDDRVSKPNNATLELRKSDTDIFIKKLSNKDLSLKQYERFIELKSHGMDFQDLPILSNTEIAYLRKISWRHWEPEKIAGIAVADFGLPKNTFKKLQNLGFISKSSKQKIITEDEHRLLREARVWLNAPQSIRSKTKKPPEAILEALKGKTQPINSGQKLMDYRIHFKTLRGETLNASERLRQSMLTENGHHPGSIEFKKWVLNEPKSWRMKIARRDEYLNHYEKVHGVNIDALKFINTFTQVTHDQLLKFGLKEEEINRYKDGVSKHYQLIQKGVLPTRDGPLTYYFLTHEGPISGRKFLEKEGVPKTEIGKRPQTRKDLLYHDLKVVSCVQKVVDLKKAEGKKLISLKSEFSQFSRQKAGKMNHERSDGPSFMDVELVFESENSQGGKSRETIAVEYGNYQTATMGNKLKNVKFDHAYVFAKPQYTNRYRKNIQVPNVSFISMN